MDNATKELLEHSVEAYGTTDFDLAAFLMTLIRDDGKPLAQLIGMTPQERHSANPGNGYKFTFHLVGTDNVNVVHVLKEMEMRYTNKQAQVEPITFMATRRQLRVLMTRHINELRNSNRKTINEKKRNRTR